jgi:hypothetical protein
MRDLTPYTSNRQIRLRFLKHIDFCQHGKACQQCHWQWTSAVNNKGYGVFSVRDYGKTIVVLSSRFMFTLRYGHTDLQVNHTCDIPLCMNYNHLYAGTHRDNMRDKVSRHRAWTNAPHGEKHGRSKLIDKDIEHIFSLRSKGYTQKSIAELLGVSQSQVNRILQRKRWGHMRLDL